MRALSTAPLLAALGLIALAGCADKAPPTRPEQPVQAWVTLSVPGMT